MSEDHQGYLDSLLSELKGLEVSLTQLGGLERQAQESGNDAKRDEYQRELTRLSLARQDLVSRIEQVRQETAELSEQQRSEFETTWQGIKEAAKRLLDNLNPKR